MFLCDMISCSLVVVHRRFRGITCFRHQWSFTDYGGIKSCSERSAGIYQTERHPS